MYQYSYFGENVQGTNDRGLIFKNFGIGVCLYFFVTNIKKISGFFVNMILNKPGVGKVEPRTLRKNKIAIINTTLGDIRVPLVKMPSFDLSMGFFTESVSFEQGLYFLKEFQGFPQHIKLKNLGTSWITDIPNPMTLNGTKNAKGFIVSYIDSSIYIFDITNNDFIDYKEIINNYEVELEENLEVELEENYEVELEENLEVEFIDNLEENLEENVEVEK